MIISSALRAGNLCSPSVILCFPPMSSSPLKRLNTASGVTLPSSSAIANVKGFKTEPGSYRYSLNLGLSEFILSFVIRFGSYLFELAITSISPVLLSITVAKISSEFVSIFMSSSISSTFL